LTDTQLATDQLFRDGQTARLNGEYDIAITVFQQVIDIRPSFAQAHMELGLALCYIGDFDASLRELAQAVELAPMYAECHLQLAKVYTMLGMYSEGAAMFRIVLTLTDPQDKLYEEAAKQLSYFKDLALDDTGDTQANDY